MSIWSTRSRTSWRIRTSMIGRSLSGISGLGSTVVSGRQAAAAPAGHEHGAHQRAPTVDRSRHSARTSASESRSAKRGVKPVDAAQERDVGHDVRRVLRDEQRGIGLAPSRRVPACAISSSTTARSVTGTPEPTLTTPLELAVQQSRGTRRRCRARRGSRARRRGCRCVASSLHARAARPMTGSARRGLGPDPRC